MAAIAANLVDIVNVIKERMNAMKINEYQRAALRTVSGINKQYPRILNGVLELAGESGECVDMVKKHLFQGHELDKKNTWQKNLVTLLGI